MQNDVFSSMSTTLKSSAGRLGRMATSGSRTQVLKLAGMIVAVVLVLWWLWGLVVRR